MTTPLRVLVSDPNLVEHQSRLEELVADVANCHWVADPTNKDGLNALAQADVFVGTTFTPAMTEHASRLQAVLVPGAGHDGIDKSALPAGVPVANTFHHEASIAEYVVACAVMLRRSLWQQAHALTDGVWASSVHDPSLSQPATLGASTIGIIGYGHIGQAVWRLLQPCWRGGGAPSSGPAFWSPSWP
ncbi:Rossmann-fold NAD(P)-binding domain-containing protein [Parenemella sanctibonifatiensis]|uniref:Uncharacterized protein n=1 Tax=Parenemella sanctibonifatiensis TaxID=2016505 RepID=A0A255EKY2_9ACTN|nr:hypothetical protein [Parenemella sanctibonifatiensis]OYN92189.1 hypothetical protein CGZ91_01380 [Parenemella sanctibonifatiensis]